MKRKAWIRAAAALLLATLLVVAAGCAGAAQSAASTVSTAAAASVTASNQASAQQNQPQNGQPQGTPPSGNPPDGSGQGGGQPGGSGSGSAAVTGTGAYTVDGKTDSQFGNKISASNADESGVIVQNKGSLSLSGVTIGKTGDTSSEDSSNFYGLNAGVLAESGGSLTIKDSTITTDSDGSNGVFSTGDGTTVNVDNVTIHTSKDSSRGLDVTMGGTLSASNVSITTLGAHCAAIASDRGGGTETVTGGTMTTAGEGSPCVYSTADITVSGATLTATGSEAAVIEGKNSITLNNVTLSGAKKRGVMLYQSTSGDAAVGTSKFTMTGGSLTALEGPLFYITNTDSVVTLNSVTLTQSSGTLLSAAADSWGNSGSNGGKVTLIAQNQTLDGNILCDKISAVALQLAGNTTLSGAINTANAGGTVTLSLDKSSVWNVTGISYLSAVTDEDATLANIHSNGFKVYYDASNNANAWLGGKTVQLAGGGELLPE